MITEPKLGKCFIYAIINKTNGLAYIGSSELPRFRVFEHIKALRNKRHTNPNLQEAWTKYGIHVFDFVLLDSCNSKDREAFEYAHINAWTPNTYNITKKQIATLVGDIQIEPLFSQEELRQLVHVNSL